jgi:hypothetical protein
VDGTWLHWGGDEDRIFDPPASQVALETDREVGASQSGRPFADELALTYPLAGRQVIEDFEGGLARLRLSNPWRRSPCGDQLVVRHFAVPSLLLDRTSRQKS